MTCLVPGRHLNIPEEDYHKLPYIGSTMIKAASNNLASCLVPIQETPDMLLGKIIHKFCLEGEEAFKKVYAIEPDYQLNKNSNDYKKKHIEFQESNNGKRIIQTYFDRTPTYSILTGIRDSLNNHPWTKHLLKEGSEELTFIWHDPITNEICKIRTDWFPGKLSIIDLKKTSDIAKFKNQINYLHYDLQAAHYTNGAEACGNPVDTFFFIAVEAYPPYALEVGYLNPERLNSAKNEVSRLIKLIHECKERKWWPNFRLPEHFTTLDQITTNVSELLHVWD